METVQQLEDSEGLVEFTERPYQVEILNVALKQNTVVYLPTGSGKTYIAILLIKHLSQDLNKSYDEGGKLTVMLVNTIPLVNQHCGVLRRLLPYEVAGYSGDMNVDLWNGNKWNEEFNKHQILVMTAQIFHDILAHNYMGLERVNLLIFDECHNGVKEQPMRMIMQKFLNVSKEQQPRVLGLTATLLNRNCSPQDVLDEVQSLETTYHSQVATVKQAASVLGFSTNPQEKFVAYQKGVSHPEVQKTMLIITGFIKFLTAMGERHKTQATSEMTKKNIFRNLTNLLKSLCQHMDMLGLYGAYKAVLAHIIQLQTMLCTTENTTLSKLIATAVTQLIVCHRRLNCVLGESTGKDRILMHASPRLLNILSVLMKAKADPEKPLRGIIFAQQRFTAQLLYYVIKDLSKEDPDYAFLRPEFIVGSNKTASHGRDDQTREALYTGKVNRRIIRQFQDGELNLLMATKVVEEGLDVSMCTLVLMFDFPNNYRSYIQSKGRARQKDSMYVMMVLESDRASHLAQYELFRRTEQVLMQLFVGKNDERDPPSDHKIQLELYNDQDIPPYYVAGPGSAHITATSSISMVNRYCQSLSHRDKYTQLVPEWYLEEEIKGMKKLYVVRIVMPILCPLRQPIRGLPMSTKVAAKRAAALEVCKQLHQIGELNNRLLPRDEFDIVEEDTFEHLFIHWPKQKFDRDPADNKKLYNIKVAECLLGKSIVPGQILHLHRIKFQPNFSGSAIKSMFSDLLTSSLCLGMISAKPLPSLCDFPLFVSPGELNVHIEVNCKTFELTPEQLQLMKNFQKFMFDDLLELLKPFLMLGHAEETGGLFVVPIRSSEADCEIAFDLIQENDSLIEVVEPSYTKKLELRVEDEDYLHSVVCPWYRATNAKYVVLKVCHDMNALTPFPNEEFPSYAAYYQEKYNVTVVNKLAPLLLVKGMSTRLNCLKPRSATLKKRKFENEEAEEFVEHLVPEMCIKQKLPSSLWYQSACLPSILHRVMLLLRVEEFRSAIARDTGMGLPEGRPWDTMPVDHTILTPETLKKREPGPQIADIGSQQLPVSEVSPPEVINKDYAKKMLEKEYPWRDEQEPPDVNRDIDNITLVDLKLYLQFVNALVDVEVPPVNITHRPSSSFPALTFEKKYESKPVNMLEVSASGRGPELWEMYQAMTAANADDTLNMERLETLGDSFLKLSISMFLFYRYPEFQEGRLTNLKGQMVGNNNLYYVGNAKRLGSSLKVSKFEPLSTWSPPGYRVPQIVIDRMVEGRLPPSKLFELPLSREEQASGTFAPETERELSEAMEAMELEQKSEDSHVEVPLLMSTLQQFLGYQMFHDKVLSDSVEALLGAYLVSDGINGGLSILSWFDIIPAGEHPERMFRQTVPSPFLNPVRTLDRDVDHILLNYQRIETTLGYHFRNRGFLLQALTHASYTKNRLTGCYQRLEFLGDAVIDFLITSHLYETSSKLTPGELTDLRSALVNNNIFASFVARHGFQKHLKCMNTQLMDNIDMFIKFQEEREFVINEEILTLMEDSDCYMAEHITVPKVLGDLFEALIGAVFLDSGMNFKTVWTVIYRIMWQEIDAFRSCVPKNPVRLLSEYPQVTPKFMKSEIMPNGSVRVSVNVTVDGKREFVHGFGKTKKEAKRAAAKMALHLLRS